MVPAGDPDRDRGRPATDSPVDDAGVSPAARAAAGARADERVSARDMMLVAAAREVQDGETVFATLGRPFVAWLLAKSVHAPLARVLLEDGSIRDAVPDHPGSAGVAVLGGATQLGGAQSVLGLLQQGRVDLGLLEAAQVDRFGNVGGSLRGAVAGDPVGIGVGTDVAQLARRSVVMVEHSPERLRARVAEVRARGRFDDDGRLRSGPGGVVAIVTDRAVIRFDRGGIPYLASTHPGVPVSEVQELTGWDLVVDERADQTPPPTALELTMLRQVDDDDH